VETDASAGEVPVFGMLESFQAPSRLADLTDLTDNG
jgi:hypothetical protein